MRPLPPKSLLDEGELPIAELARIAMREGVRPRAVYQAHKWFARRFAVTARALLVAGASKQGAAFWPAFYRGDSWIGRTVLDPFVGGGVMLLEASRLGARVRGVDIEPVAAAIARFQTTLRKVPDLDIPLQKLLDTVGKTLAPYYEAEDEAGKRETLLHAFWVQAIDCDDCGHSFDAHPSFRIAWDDTTQRQWVACSTCSCVREVALGATSFVCNCGQRTNTRGGHIDGGEVCCPKCGWKEQLISYARGTSGPPNFRIFAVETLPSKEDRRFGIPSRRIRTATEFDRARYRQASQRLHEIVAKNPRILPVVKIPKVGRSDNRLIDYGYTDYGQLFNARQRLHLALLGQAICRLKGSARDALAIAFSDHLTTNNMMCAYAGGWRRLTPLFSIRAYRHIARPIEINPWLTKNGRGTFPNAVRAVARACEALKNPKEPTPKGLLKEVDDAKPGAVDVMCGDARRLSHISTASVDFVLTDPPYFDYISYSELGHFFVPWFIRFGLIRSKHARGFPVGQLASGARSGEAENRFASRLASAFKEVRRVCKNDGRVVFTYQNLDGRGWQAIATAMARAGVIPFRTLPLYGDSNTSLHKHAQSISWDCVMICRVGEPMTRLRIDRLAREAGEIAADQWTRFLRRKDLPVTNGDQINMAHAAAIVEAFAQRLLVLPAKRQEVRG
jgi:putative DNA methylase